MQKTWTSSGRSKGCLAAAYRSKKEKKLAHSINCCSLLRLFMIHGQGRPQVYALCRINKKNDVDRTKTCASIRLSIVISSKFHLLKK